MNAEYATIVEKNNIRGQQKSEQVFTSSDNALDYLREQLAACRDGFTFTVSNCPKWEYDLLS